MTSNQLEAYQKDDRFPKVSVMKITRRGSVRLKRNLLRQLSGETDQKRVLKKSRSVKFSSVGSSRSSNKQMNLRQPEWASSGRVLRRTPTLGVLRSTKSSVQKATCSSTVKGSNFPDHLETQPQSEAKVCKYSYCSLHGHRQASPPPLKRLISVRRRALKNGRGLKPEAQHSAKKKQAQAQAQPRNVNTITNTTDELHGDDTISNGVHDTESCSFSSASVEPPEILSDSSSVGGAVVQQPAASDEETNHNLAAATNYGKIKLRSGNGRNFRLWNLLYQHMVTGLSAEAERQPPVDASEPGSTQNFSGNGHAIKVEPCNESDQNLELRQSDAVKLVQQAFNKLLSEIPDDTSDHYSSIASDGNILLEERNEGTEANHTEPQDLGLDEHRVDFPGAAELPVEQESEKQMPKRWSNLKKLIILRRFVNELSSVKNFHRPKLQNQPIEHGPETERVHLRHPIVVGRKNAHEWMLDYALGQVISTLAPSQKRKVDLLVQAFETVIPGMNMSRISPARGSESLIPAADRGTKVNHAETTIGETEAPETCPKNHLDQASESSIQQSNSESLTQKGSDLQFGSVGASKPVLNMEMTDMELKKEEDNILDGKQSRKPCGTGSILEDDAECASSKQIPENGTLPNAFERGISTSVSDSSLNNYQDRKLVPDETAVQQGELEKRVETMPGNDQPEHDLCQSPPPAELNVTAASLAEGNRLEKQRYTRLWYLLYKHMVSTSAEEKSHQLLGEEAKQEEGGDGVRSLLKEGNGDTLPSSTADHDTIPKIHRADDHNIELQDEVIKLVEEAIDEIPLSDDPEAPEKNRIEGEGGFIQEVSQIVVKDVHEEPEKRKDGLNTTVFGSGNNGSEEDATGVPNGENKYKSQGQKNWSNLKKLILIRRFVKSLEKVKAFNPGGPRFLHQSNTPEPEKVNLRHLDMEDRKNSDEWMLDHALQQVVAKLTPARKRRVELLVEAFETVVPDDTLFIPHGRAMRGLVAI